MNNFDSASPKKALDRWTEPRTKKRRRTDLRLQHDYLLSSAAGAAVDDYTLEDCSEALQDHAFNPRNNHSIPAPDGLARVENPSQGCAVRISLRVENDRVQDVAFRAFGDLMVTACGSWLCQCVLGLAPNDILELEPDCLAQALQLPERFQWCMQLALDCMNAAVMNYRQGRWGEGHLPLPPARHRHRKRRAVETERAEEDAELHYIEGLLTNLLLFHEVGTSARHVHDDTNSKLREDLLCDLAAVRQIIPTLPQAQRKVIILIGIHGLNFREAAVELRISHVAVQLRLRKAAKLIRETWRKPRFPRR